MRKQTLHFYTERLLMKQIFWAVGPRGWGNCSRSFEEIYRLHPQGYKSIHSMFTQKVGKQLHNHTMQQPTRPMSSVTNEIFQRCAISRG
jgi:hypothetical protein